LNVKNQLQNIVVVNVKIELDNYEYNPDKIYGIQIKFALYVVQFLFLKQHQRIKEVVVIIVCLMEFNLHEGCF
jgi:hypothetical protein